MKKLKLIIKEKGRYIEIPGISAFRTPAKVDVTKIKLSILIQSLHSGGVNNYELISSDEKGDIIYTEEDFKLPEKDNKIDDRLGRLEDLLLKLISNGRGQKVTSSEQITNRLNRIERMLRSGTNVVHTSNEGPDIEELDNQYIPNIDISEMQISGKITEIVDKKDEKEIDDAVNLLSNLTRNGGK